MFYETERIVRKQQKYVKIKAYSTISRLENKGLSVSEMTNAIDILLTDENTEFQQDILKLAKHILESRKESSGEVNECNKGSGDRIDFSSCCPILVGS
jgi:hypothetical protein